MIGKILKFRNTNLLSRFDFVERHSLPISGSKIVKTRSQGFTLLELMITMFILIILLSVAIPTYQRSVLHAKETVLEQNLWQIRRSIDQYATDKGRLPQRIQDLVDEGYLREIPVDPMNEERAEWAEIQGEDKYSGNGDQGLVDVKSLAQGADSQGKNYSDY